MVADETFGARRTRMMNRVHARWATWSRPATAFVSRPEPRAIGDLHRGRQLVAGNFLFSGYLVEARNHSIWDVPSPDASFEMQLHGFSWLDDLAALGDLEARSRAQDWTHDWIARFGRGSGPGWSPELTGRRLIRWISHAVFLLNGRSPKTSDAFFRSLAQQTRFLGRRWKVATPGLARIEALTGLIYAGLSLTGMEREMGPAATALARECARRIDKEGGIPTRNPEDLLDVFTLLNWAAVALGEAGRRPAQEHLDAIHRIAAILRGLRHADGSLARFHGGGRGKPGWLDAALAASGVPPRALGHRFMGFERLAHGRTTILMDAAPPPAKAISADAHASTLAFELTSGRRPLIVNCGAGRLFGSSWRRAGRSTTSHSTLCIEGISSSRIGLGNLRSGGRAEVLVETPRDVRAEHQPTRTGTAVTASHDGYRASYGLTHVRRLELSSDGRSLTGTDRMMAVSTKDHRIFDRVLDRTGLRGIPLQVRFHLHPDVEASLDLGETAISLKLKSGEVWIFRSDSPAKLTLELSVYLQTGRLAPRASQQIVLTMDATSRDTEIDWTLGKAQDTPSFVRDVAEDQILEFH